jgi:hypothetical protein
MNRTMNNEHDKLAARPEVESTDPHLMTTGQLARLGLSQIAYIKPVMVQGARAFAIHGADGTPMGVADGLDVALAAIVQHEMLPALVH